MQRDLLYKDLTYRIRGAIFNVYNNLGFGHKESVYTNALSIEFEKNKIKHEREKNLIITYDSKIVGYYKPDFVVDNKIIIEIKSSEFMTINVEKQLIYYLKGTNYKLGLLVNFGGSKLIIRRKIWSLDQ